MSIDLGYHFTRYAFFAFNVLFWLLGCGCLGIGIWLYVVKTEYQSLTPANYGALSAAGLSIAGGAAIVIIGFVGCCGAWVESKYLLITYFVFVLVVFGIELVVGVLGVLYKEEVTETIHHELFTHLNSPYVMGDQQPNGIRLTWDKMQNEFECCGVDSYRDWFKSPRWTGRDWVPDSCCDESKFSSAEELSSENCGKVANASLWYQQGCFEAFSTWLLEHMHIVGVIGLLLAAVQVFGLVSSMVLFCGLSERNGRPYAYHKP